MALLLARPAFPSRGGSRRLRGLPPCAAAEPAAPLAPLLAAEPAGVRSSASAFAPATVANLGPGFDFLGCAVEGQGDVVTATLRPDLFGGSVQISGCVGDGGRLSLVPSQNCCGIAAAATLQLLGVRSAGVSLAIRKGLPLGSGLGSSAASAAAACWAVNLLFGQPLSRAQLVAAGLVSEAAVSGFHADNIAPALMGGFSLVCSYAPLTLRPLPFGGPPESLWFVLVTPVFEAPTREMRAALPAAVSRQVHVANAAAGAQLVAAILTGDAALLGAALGAGDTIVEPARGPLIPGFFAVKAAAAAAGALGCTISGAGPTVVALAPSADAGRRIAAAMAAAFRADGGLEVAYAAVSQLCAGGARECEADDAGSTQGVIRLV